MGVKTQLGWLVKGGSRTNNALSRYAEDLRALQHKVARIDAELQALQATTTHQIRHVGDRAEHTQTEVLALQVQLRTVVDDLGDRVGSLTERLNSTG